MQRDVDTTPEPACMVVVKGDDLHVVSAFWSAYGDGGHGYHKVRASHVLNELRAQPGVLGQAVRAAFAQFYIVPTKADEPRLDALDELAGGDSGKFLKGASRVILIPDSDAGVLHYVGGYSYTKNGFENLDKCAGTLPENASDETVGQAILDMFKKIARKAAKRST